MIETFSTNRQDKKSYWFSLLALEPVEVKLYISSGDDNLQCILCQQDRPLQLQTSNCNASLKLSCKYSTRSRWPTRQLNGTIDRTSQDSTLETYGDKSGFDQSLILKTIAGKLQLFFGELIKCFQVTEQIVSFFSVRHIEINHQNLLMWDL